MTDNLRKVTLYKTPDIGMTHYRILEHSGDHRWMPYTEYKPGCYRVTQDQHGHKQIAKEYVIPEEDILLIDGVNCEVEELGTITCNKNKAKRVRWTLTKIGDIHKMAQKNVPVEDIVEGVKSLSECSRAMFLGSLDSETLNKIADYLGVGHSRYSICNFLNQDHAITEKIAKLIEPIESLLEELKAATKKK